MLPTGQPKQVTVSDIIHADQRVIELKKVYAGFQNKKNEIILDLSRVEADIIKTMGAFEYLNKFSEIDEAQKELLPEFRRLITRKNVLIEEVKNAETALENCTTTFNKLAEQIVADLKKQFRQPQSAESCPESCPDCDGNCGCQTADHTED